MTNEQGLNRRLAEQNYYWCWKCGRTHSTDSKIGKSHIFQKGSKESILQPPEDTESIRELLEE